MKTICNFGKTFQFHQEKWLHNDEFSENPWFNLHSILPHNNADKRMIIFRGHNMCATIKISFYSKDVIAEQRTKCFNHLPSSWAKYSWAAYTYTTALLVIILVLLPILTFTCLCKCVPVVSITTLIVFVTSKE